MLAELATTLKSIFCLVGSPALGLEWFDVSRVRGLRSVAGLGPGPGLDDVTVGSERPLDSHRASTLRPCGEAGVLHARTSFQLNSQRQIQLQ